MAYYKKVLQPGETVKCVGRLHWFIYTHAIVLLMLALIVPWLIASSTGELGNVALIVLFIFLVLAFIAFVQSWFLQITTEIVVTDKRVIHKVGWIARRTEEINITKVETVDVIQGVAGRVFGFGAVLIKGVGGSWEPLLYIASPLLLRNAIVVG